MSGVWGREKRKMGKWESKQILYGSQQGGVFELIQAVRIGQEPDALAQGS